MILKLERYMKTGRTFFSIDFTDGKIFKRQFQLGGFACRPLCGYNLRRPHFTCLTCRFRRMFYRKMPRKIEVNVVSHKRGVLIIHKKRRFAKVKDILLRKLLPYAKHPRLVTICEFLAN